MAQAVNDADDFHVLRGQCRVPRAESDTWPSTIPWAFVAPHGAQALRNHDQTLERLNERGGLSPLEIFAVVHDRHYRDVLRAGMTESLAGTWLRGVAGLSFCPCVSSQVSS